MIDHDKLTARSPDSYALFTGQGTCIAAAAQRATRAFQIPSPRQDPRK